jgi:hypothetical protein
MAYFYHPTIVLQLSQPCHRDAQMQHGNVSVCNQLLHRLKFQHIASTLQLKKLKRCHVVPRVDHTT